MKNQEQVKARAFSVDVDPKHLALCGVKARYAQDLDIEELRILVTWCGWQDEDLWEGMTLQEILNVYRVSAEWDNWEAWLQNSPLQARGAWNRVVEAKNFLVE